MAKVAIIAALEREVAGAIRNWRASKREFGGWRYKFFENQRAVLVCAGMGAEAARRACEAVIRLYEPSLVISVGLAGGLDGSVQLGSLLIPDRLIDASDGSSLDIGSGHGTLVSWNSIAGIDQKAKLARSYGAQAVDMEAAAVARGALARGVSFMAVKAISDAHNFEFPGLQRFIAADGRFRTAALVMFSAMRPWLWGKLLYLRRNSQLAANGLCDWLERYNQPLSNVGAMNSELHPMGLERH